MELTVKNEDLVFVGEHFDFEAFLKDDYNEIFDSNWDNTKFSSMNFMEITTEESEIIMKLISSKSDYFMTYFPVKENLPKYRIEGLQDIINLFSNGTFNWFEPFIIFSNNLIFINEPDAEICFISNR